MEIKVVPYDPAWPELFRREAELIEAILGNNLLACHHIGSSSVPGLAAKPIIDMLPIVRDLAEVDARQSEFAAAGYEALGEYGLPGRRFFRKGGVCNIHIYRYDNTSEIARHLAVPAYLRAHAEAAAAYAQLKQQLAAQFPHDLDAYCDGKDEFVKQMEQQALAWLWQSGPMGAASLNNWGPDNGPFYHGTKAALQPNDLLAPGYSSNYGTQQTANYVYMAATMDAAIWGAELALGDAPGRIYRVEPTGEFENDPNLTDKKFPGNPTRSYRTKHPLRVIGEVADWQGHDPEVLQQMLDNLAELKRQGVEAIND